MTSQRRRASTRLATQLAELSVAAPTVVAERVSRMARAGARPSAAQQRENVAMGAEKVTAFQQSWLAMSMSMMQVQQQMWGASWSALMAAMQGRPMPLRAGNSFAQATSQVLSAGVAPIHRKAVANARRLTRTRR